MKKVLWISRMEPNKRPRDALDIIRKLRSRTKEAELYMVGEGNLLQSVRDVAKDAEGIHVLGRVSDNQKDKLLRTCDVLISTSEFEGFGLTIGEAFLKGKPVVAYEIPSLRSVYGSTIVYVKLGNTEDFVDKLHRVLTDDEYARKKASEGKNKVISEYSTEVVATKVEKALKETLRR